MQRDNDVQIKVSNDRQSQWVDLTISGSNDQVIDNTFNHIKNLTGSVKEKNESIQTKSFAQPGIFYIFQWLFFIDYFIDFGNNNTSSFSFSKTNENTSRNSNGFFSANYQNNDRNDNNTYSNGAHNTFNTRGRGFSGLIILLIHLLK